MSPKFCPFCGKPTKKSDKFCIICGKPLLTDIPKSEKKKDFGEPSKVEEKQISEKEEHEEELEHDEQKEEIIDLTKTDKETKKSKKKVDYKEVQALPEDVKEQMEYYIEFNDIQLNKKVLAEKLNEISKLTKDSRYEYDSDFKKDVNIKLEAIKTLISEMKQKESVVKQNLEEPFIVQRINSNIKKKVFQLENLSREHKLRKVDHETFKKLKEKYKQEKFELETERDELIIGMKLWIQDLKMEKAELSSERKLNKGRYHSKEITEEEFQANDKDFDLRLKKNQTKIKTLDVLTK
ncbi:hypothetical protein LCGC14_0815080 [marine sediment metagenome]|uniref:Zinc-ribbon domain-containing protein n=1 Tax=marine sediment metagenome TaxID=412755 RepID=A0A0F9PKI7_9ZZZZ|nr:MAG: hypothetical protein Lokiarch_03970 [Candidatus Lokiarchaeum sp. GC14_75]